MTDTRLDRPWTPARDAILTRLLAEGVALDFIAERLCVSKDKVARRRLFLGLKPRKVRRA